MAVVTWTPTQLSGNGAATVAATQNGSLSTSDTYRWLNTGKEILSIDKGANAANATVTTAATQRGIAIADTVHALAASTEDQLIGPFSPDVYNDADGYCTVAFSEITGLTATLIRVP